MQCGSPSPLIWRSLSSMFGRQHDVTGSTSRSADDFAAFFAKKIDDIRNDTAGLPPPVISRAPSSLTSFHQYTEAEVRRIVMKSPIKSCSLDPAPTFFLHEFIDLLLPYATRIVNASPAQGRLPLSQRHAIVTPLLKKNQVKMGAICPTTDLWCLTSASCQKSSNVS